MPGRDASSIPGSSSENQLSHWPQDAVITAVALQDNLTQPPAG